MLKILPTVQFSNDEGLATRENITDLRPADISIAGGRYYDNLVTLDGIDVNSRMDTTQTTPENVYELAGASAESIWVDANLIGEITVRDSNFSAQYVRFTGGMLDVRTRAPRRAWRLTSSVSYTSDALTHFRISDKSREALADADMPEKPAFEKWCYGVTVDIPVSADVGLLIAYNRLRADVTYQRSAAYGSPRFGQTSSSDNVLAKVDADLSGDLKLTGQSVYSPYSSEYADDAAVENTITSKGGGITVKLELAHSGDSDWTVTGTFSHSDYRARGRTDALQGAFLDDDGQHLHLHQLDHRQLRRSRPDPGQLLPDPGYRPEGEVRYRQAIDAYFAKLDATPKSALQARFGSLTSGGDPRFSLGSPEDYRALSYAGLKAAIGERLAHGAIEIGLVGDLDEQAAIALVAALSAPCHPARRPSIRGTRNRPGSSRRERPAT